ncbi:MAG: hypothetical protein ACYS8W_00060 [Planctomycetota bacterium]
MQQLEKIREDYEAGLYADLLADLKTFIRKERKGILQEASRLKAASTCECPDIEYLKVAAKFHIIRSGGINIKKENRAQVEEIFAEKWIRNKDNPSELDFNEVALDWARRHSAGWRDNRILIYIYVFEQEVDSFIKLLSEE